MKKVWSLFLLFILCSSVGAENRTRTTVGVSLAPVFREPVESSEQVTQVLFGDQVNVRRVKGGWAEVLVPDQYRTSQGYPGWVRVSHLTKNLVAGEKDFVTVAYPLVHLRAEPRTDSRSVTQVYLASRLPVAGATERDESGEQWIAVRPEGQKDSLWVRASQVAEEKPLSLDQGKAIIERAKLFEGTPYLWGGMSFEGIDCSGLVYTVYRLHGITVPRDADQQFQIGTKVAKKDLKPGDMVFFGKAENDITHVGLYAGSGNFVHASSGRGVLESKLFQGWYLERYQGARRILKASPEQIETLTPITEPRRGIKLDEAHGTTEFCRERPESLPQDDSW